MGELAAPHADQIEAGESGVLAAGEGERDHVVAHAGQRADHHLRAHPAELMHGRKAADENVVADLAMSAQCRRSGKDDVVADHAVVADMAAIHEVAAISNPGDAAAGDRPGAHGRLLPDSAALADLEPGE